MDLQEKIAIAAERIKQAEAILISAGAGMGVDSGLPDFRGNEGFWKAYPFAKKLGVSFSAMANPAWFEKDPHLAWAFYGHRLNMYRATVPHEGFRLLLKWGEEKKYGYFVFTSNVDGQFQKAGFSEQRIVEVHGSIHHLQCTVPCSEDIWSAEKTKVEIDAEEFRAKEPLPRCPYCGAIARPNILMFGDWTWISLRTKAQSARYSSWVSQFKHMGDKLVIIEMGAGTAVPTVRHNDEEIASLYESFLIRINPREAHIPRGIKGIELPIGAKEALFAIDNLLNK